MGALLRTKKIVSYLLLGLVMIHYQSCAPSNEAMIQEFSADVHDVNGIDSVAVGGISFPQNKMAAFADQKLTAVGVCEQSGAMISWKLNGPDGQAIERGLAACETGSFEIELSNQWQSFCDETLVLQAALGAKASSSMELEANCN